MLPNKISIIGAPGTGKTTLAIKLSKIYNLPRYHIDGIHHLKNWEIRDKEERDKIILEKIKENKWVFDGTYKSTLVPRLKQSDLVIWLDYTTFTQLKGIIKRWIINSGKEKDEIPGCKEKIDLDFILYVLKYNKEKRFYILDAIQKSNINNIIIFKNRKDLTKWLESQK